MTANKIIRPPEIQGDIALVPLTKGQVAIIDATDAALVGEWNWLALARPNGRGFYAVTASYRGGKKQTFYMHRLIVGASAGFEVDHINQDTLNNRRGNLRLATHSQNKWNTRARVNNTSGFKGVSLEKKSGKWVAMISAKNRQKRIGTFSTPEEAYAAYCEAAQRLHGDFARIS